MQRNTSKTSGWQSADDGLAERGHRTEPLSSGRAHGFPKVVVVGAGMAGLSATRWLRREGWPRDRVVLLEASGDIGGRMRTKQHISGALCDHGAAYIHGTIGNPLTALADEARIELKQVSESNPWVENSSAVAVYVGGKRAAALEIAETDAAFTELVRRVTERAQDCKDPFVSARGSIEEILQEEPFSSLSADGLSRVRLRLFTLSLWHGCDLEDLPLRSMDFQMLGENPLRGGQGLSGDFPGPHCLVKGGVGRIARAVANQEVRECLRLNALVNRVSIVNGDTVHPTGGVTAAEEGKESDVGERGGNTAEGSGGVRVCVGIGGSRSGERGESVWADAVVVAVPLSLLQQGLVEFDPPIPEETRSAMSRLRLGIYEKIIMEFEEPFWPADVPFIACCPQLSSPASMAQAPPPLSSSPKSAEHWAEARRGGGGHSEQPTSSASAASLTAGLVLLENYLCSKGVPILSTAFSGDSGMMVAAAATADAAATGKTEGENDEREEKSNIRKISPRAMKIYHRLVKPALDDAFGGGEGVPEPVSIVITSWANDPLQRGSYSYVPLGARDDDIYFAGAGAAMGSSGAAPGTLWPERVFFAGEATSIGYEGSMHGAFLSGVRAAEDVARAFDILPV